MAPRRSRQPSRAAEAFLIESQGSADAKVIRAANGLIRIFMQLPRGLTRVVPLPESRMDAPSVRWQRAILQNAQKSPTCLCFSASHGASFTSLRSADFSLLEKVFYVVTQCKKA